MGASVTDLEMAMLANAGAPRGAGKHAGSCESGVCPECGAEFASARWATRHRRHLCRGVRRSGLLLKRSSSSLTRRAARLLHPGRVRPAAVVSSFLGGEGGRLAGGDVRMVSALLRGGRGRLVPPDPTCRRIAVSRKRLTFSKGRQRWPPPRDSLWCLTEAGAEGAVPAALDTSVQEIQRCFIPSICICI